MKANWESANDANKTNDVKKHKKIFAFIRVNSLTKTFATIRDIR